MTNEISNILRGVKSVTKSDFIQTIRSYLATSKESSRIASKSKLFNKKDEEQVIIKYIIDNNIQIEINEENYIAEGAEQKVFLHSDGKHVIKTSDSVFYEYWEDYLTSLLIHNYLFPNTAYELLGFIIRSEKLYAVVKQRFIIISESTNLAFVKEFMKANNFINTKNNDYINNDLGIILEDLHDENVITNNGILFFIDTVIYLKQ